MIVFRLYNSSVERLQAEVTIVRRPGLDSIRFLACLNLRLWIHEDEDQ